MIKKISLLFILVFSLSLTRLYAWQIDSFQVDIALNKDSSVMVTEKILANFSDQAKHGIFRNIPVSYRDEKGNQLQFSLKILGIYDEDGNPWQYSEYYSAGFKVLKIGSPNRTYTTQKTFLIKYTVEGAVLYLGNHDELFWNAIGTEWDAPINNVTINLHLPEAVKQELLSTAVYSGRYGSRSSNVSTQILDERNITFKGSHYLPYEGLTIVVGFPKGIVQEYQPALNQPDDAKATPYTYAEGNYPAYPASYNWLYLFICTALPLIIFIAMFYIWEKYGKDPRFLKSVVVEYQAPQDLTPAEIGTLIDDKVDVRDISATIIDLAVKGYLKIVKQDAFFHKSYSFVKLKEFSSDSSLTSFEKKILEGIFQERQLGSASIGEIVNLDDLENNFYKKLALIKQEIYTRLINKGYYDRDPEKMVLAYRRWGIIIAVGAFFLMPNLTLLGISLGVCALIIFIFAKYMPAKTKRGMDVYGRILGFEEFLTRTDKDKILFQERQNIFEKMLPFAICLGISSQWAKVFADLYQQAPAWFSADYGRGFSMDYFIRDLNRTMHSFNTTLVSAPRTVSSGGGFGGGGFSGGGFGGGGGSSW